MGRRDARASRRDRAAEFARRHSRGVPPPSPGRFTPRSPAREIMPGAVRIVVGAFRSRCASRNSSRAARSSRAAAGNDTRPIVKCFDGSRETTRGRPRATRSHVDPRRSRTDDERERDARGGATMRGSRRLRPPGVRVSPPKETSSSRPDDRRFVGGSIGRVVHPLDGALDSFRGRVEGLERDPLHA